MIDARTTCHIVSTYTADRLNGQRLESIDNNFFFWVLLTIQLFFWPIFIIIWELLWS